MDLFQQILWDLGEIIDVPLHIDNNNACKILLNEKLAIQLEMDTHEEYLLIAAFIGELPPGKFRENILREALKINGTYHPFGSFSYMEKTNMLILHDFFPAAHLSAEKLIKHLELIIKEAEEWRQAIANGEVCPTKYLKYQSKPLS